ncbi:hypothetical protein EDB19DRAFT_1700357 [Suillus lakei]|nr:hypothetical protein EDB19DRAFT_1700357 [Suillus lakei]
MGTGLTLVAYLFVHTRIFSLTFILHSFQLVYTCSRLYVFILTCLHSLRFVLACLHSFQLIGECRAMRQWGVVSSATCSLTSQHLHMFVSFRLPIPC